MPKRIAVLLSGRGSNYRALDEAIVEGRLDAEIVSVISNVGDAAGLAHARERGHHAHAVVNRSFASREEHEAAVLEVLDRASPDFICLAGYMRRLSSGFVARWHQRIVNIHPSLLPAFPGLNAQAQAVAYGVRYSGCTVHFVDEGVDSGPIIVQRVVEVLSDDDAESLAARILPEEHRAYVDAMRLLCSDAWRIDGRRVIAE